VVQRRSATSISPTSYAPRSGEPVHSARPMTRGEVGQVVAESTEAAQILLHTSPDERRNWLCALADALERHRVELVDLADLETALGRDRLTGELGRITDAIRFYGDVAAEGSYLDLAIDEAASLTRINRPLGPVAVFGASNFPFVLGAAGHDAAAAIAAGCSVVAKAHEAHLGLSLRLADITTTALTSAGAPAGTYGMVVGFDAGAELVRSPGITVLAFTGSERAGRTLWRIANERPVPIPVYAEMGTVNPVVVTRRAVAGLDAIASGFVGCYTNSAGQYCSKPGLLFVPAGADAARRVAAALRAADPHPIMLTEAIAGAVRAGLSEFERAGARTVARLREDGAGWSAPAALLEAPISAITPGSTLLEECFGAVAIVTEYQTDAELHTALRAMQPALVAAVWTTEDGTDNQVPGVLEILTGKVGRVVQNGWTTGANHSWAQQHGGPWPATSNATGTSIGAASLSRFVRPVGFQAVRDDWLPEGARRANPWGVTRRVNGVLEPSARRVP
jgi:NADP-dependent aldehyde dehydrogenase